MGVAVLLFLARVVLLPSTLCSKLTATMIEAATSTLLSGYVRSCSTQKANAIVRRRLSSAIMQVADRNASALLFQPSCITTLVTFFTEEASSGLCGSRRHLIPPPLCLWGSRFSPPR